MLDFLPAPLKGILAALLILLNTLVLYPVLLFFALIKLTIPATRVRKVCTHALNGVARAWIGFNNALVDMLHRVEWDVRGVDELSRDQWYFVTCNHQSWADVPAIQYVMNRRIPLLKFFLKRELIRVPLLGLAWWALDFPFMHRHTKEQIARSPELKGKDMEVTKAACEKFRYTPVAILNFMEGTRFTPEKHRRQKSPYRHLLRPKAGGSAFVLEAMGDIIHTMLDVTIVYPDGRCSFWDYLCGRIRRIVIDVRTLEIPSHFLGMDYGNDRRIRADFQSWVGELWAAKDARIEALQNEYAHRAD